MCQVVTGITRKTRYGPEGTHTLGGQGRRLRKQHWNRGLLVRERHSEVCGAVIWAAELEMPLLGARPGRAGIWGAGASRLEWSWGRKGAGEPSRRAQDSSGAGEREQHRPQTPQPASPIAPPTPAEWSSQSLQPGVSRGGAGGTCPPAQALVPPPSLFCDVFLRVTHPRPLWGNSWAVDHRPALVTGYSGS